MEFSEQNRVSSYNTLRIDIPYEYIKKKVTLSWCDIEFGIKNNYFGKEVIRDFSIDLLETSEEHEYQTLIDIAILDVNDISLDVIPVICGNINKEIVEKKWLFIVLSFVYDYREVYDDVFRVVEIIYDDFDFPEEVESFIRFLPPVQKTEMTEISYPDRLYQNWKQYLDNSQFKL